MILFFANEKYFMWQKVSVEEGSKGGCQPHWLFSIGKQRLCSLPSLTKGCNMVTGLGFC